MTNEIANRPPSKIAASQQWQDVEMTPELLEALQKLGVDPNAVTAPAIPVFFPIELEDLCSQPTSYRKGLGESPLMVCQAVQQFPEADKFAGYIGYFRAECVTIDGEFVSWTHYLCHAETGEFGPLAEWVKACSVPFYSKIVHVATNSPGRTVYRPLPVAARPPQHQDARNK